MVFQILKLFCQQAFTKSVQRDKTFVFSMHNVVACTNTMSRAQRNGSSKTAYSLETVLSDDTLFYLQVSGRLVSGQNPASATKTAEEMKKLLQ